MFLFYFILFLVIFSTTSYLINKLRNFPPTLFPTLPIIGHLYVLENPSHFHRTLTQISKRLGPVCHLWFGSRPVLIVSSPSAVEECVKQQDTVFANRPLSTTSGKIIAYNNTTLIGSPYNDHWKKLRRISTLEILTPNRLSALSYVRADEVRLLLLRLFRLSDSGQDHRTPALNMRSLFMEVTLNTMMRMIVGKRYYEDCIVSAEDTEEAEMFREMITESIKSVSFTLVSDFVPVLRKFGVEKEIERNMIELRNSREKFMQVLLENQKKAARNEGKKANTMIEALLALQESEPEYYKDNIIKALMLDLLAAGTETSAGTMEIALCFLLNHPEVLKKAHTELVTYVGEDRLVNESDLANLPYLHCIIKETLRLLPPGPLIPRSTSKETTIGGYRVPSGCMVILNIWAIQRDPKIWSEPEKFMPERFLGSEGSKEGFVNLPFGYGRRACPGENLAWHMVGLTLGSVIQCFEWEKESEINGVDMSEHLRGLTLSMTNPFLAKCRPRSTMIKVLSQI